MAGWATHILETDRMSAALRRALEDGGTLGTDLRNELSILERPGRCPVDARGWEFTERGEARRHLPDPTLVAPRF